MSIFGFRPEVESFQAFGLWLCTLNHSLRLPDTEQCLLNLFRPTPDTHQFPVDIIFANLFAKFNILNRDSDFLRGKTGLELEI